MIFARDGLCNSTWTVKMMTVNKDKYTIGQMAKLCNVSTKQLRFYDERGLVTPAYRDEINGYRYYERRQIEEILLLSELKQYNFSLEKIGRLLRNRELADQIGRASCRERV